MLANFALCEFGKRSTNSNVKTLTAYQSCREPCSARVLQEFA